VLRAGVLPMTAPAVPWRDVAARLQPFVARRVPACDVDDVLQDVLLRMHRGLDSVRDDDRLTSWMFQIARAAIADRGRDRARHPVAARGDGDATAGDTADTAEPGSAAAALASCLTMFVARLPSPYREAVTLVELDGLTTQAAAERAGVSVSGMKSRVQRGRARLRCMLEDCCDIAVDPRGGVVDVEPRAPGPCRCA
jgi:RNA polymerase sigma-70 factor (ECF subfamily)